MNNRSAYTQSKTGKRRYNTRDRKLYSSSLRFSNIMTAFLPPNLLALFAARDPIPYLTPTDKLGHEKKRLGYGGVAIFLKEFEVGITLVQFYHVLRHICFKLIKINR